MEDKLFTVKIIAQTGPLFEGKAESVTLPTADGQITILADHAGLVSLLDVGEVVLKAKGEKMPSFLVSGGVTRFGGGALTVLVEEGVVTSEVVKAEIEEAVKNAQQQKLATTDPVELIQLEKRLKYEMFKKKYFE